jgi:hypothetical protein
LFVDITFAGLPFTVTTAGSFNNPEKRRPAMSSLQRSWSSLFTSKSRGALVLAPTWIRFTAS